MAANNRGQARLETYQDKQQQWRWRIWRGSRIVAESGEGYARTDSLQRALGRLRMLFPTLVKGKPKRRPKRQPKSPAKS